jgi:hypothetical protein
MLCVKLIVEPTGREHLRHHVLLACDEFVLDVNASPHMVLKTAGRPFNGQRWFTQDAKTRFYVTLEGKTVMSGHAVFEKDVLTDYAYDGHARVAA